MRFCCSVKHIGFMRNRPSELYVYRLLMRKGFSLMDIHCTVRVSLRFLCVRNWLSWLLSFGGQLPHGDFVRASDFIRRLKKHLFAARRKWRSLGIAEPISRFASKCIRSDDTQVGRDFLYLLLKKKNFAFSWTVQIIANIFLLNWHFDTLPRIAMTI
uniref:Uncharacterized protein n=1 Tax=Wuchereria bancrofti TaxID=6293 RepID=A0A1I8EQU8_WUCBA